MIYLASPYSHPDAGVRQARFEAARHALHHLLIQNKWAYSPIVYCHPIAIAHELPLDAAFWRDFNQHMMRRTTHLLILRIDGWEASVGIQEEVAYAKELNLPWSYL